MESEELKKLLHETEKKYLYFDFNLHSSVLARIRDLCPSVVEICEVVSRGSYVEALKNAEVQKALTVDGKICEMGITEYYKSCLSAYLDKLPGIAGQHVVLSIGISALELFAQHNFTGPCLGSLPFDILPGLLVSDGLTPSDVLAKALRELVLDTEDIHSQVIGAEYLIIAKVVLSHLKDQLRDCISTAWWGMRCHLLYQRVADERSTQLFESLITAVEEVETNSHLVNICPDTNSASDTSRDLTSLFYLETGHLFLHYYNVGRAKEYFHKAATSMGIMVMLSGALGKRTKWQLEDRAQMVVQVAYDHQYIAADHEEQAVLLSTDLPKDVVLTDDTRLNHIKFSDTDTDLIPNMRPIEQCYLLSDVVYRRRSQASDLQLDEETRAYLTAVLQHPQVWIVQMSALMLRSLVEVGDSRAADRSLMQLEELVSALDRSEPSRYERLKLFYASQSIPRWEVHRELARTLVRLGCTKSALEIFEQLHLWEDAVACYNDLQMRQRSAEIVRIQLSKAESPKLWCLLGDATDNVECYEKAWESSGHRSARSQRCLGNYYYVRKEYHKAITYYDQSVKLNYLELPTWLRLAYSALQTEDWSKCAQAYRTCSVLEPDSFEIWNNLSQAYLKQGERHRAWKALQEALRCRTDSWRLWDNFMLVSTALGYMWHGVDAYKKILALKERHVDTDILGHVVKAVVKGGQDPDGRDYACLYPLCLELLGQLTGQVPTNPELWFLYGQLVAAQPDCSPESKYKAMQAFRKSVAAASQKNNWEKELMTAQDVLDRTVVLLDATVMAAQDLSPKAALIELSSVRLAVQGVMSRCRQGQTSIITGELQAEVAEALAKVEGGFARLMECIETVKGKLV